VTTLIVFDYDRTLTHIDSYGVFDKIDIDADPQKNLIEQDQLADLMAKLQHSGALVAIASKGRNRARIEQSLQILNLPQTCLLQAFFPEKETLLPHFSMEQINAFNQRYQHLWTSSYGVLTNFSLDLPSQYQQKLFDLIKSDKIDFDRAGGGKNIHIANLMVMYQANAGHTIDKIFLLDDRIDNISASIYFNDLTRQLALDCPEIDISTIHATSDVDYFEKLRQSHYSTLARRK